MKGVGKGHTNNPAGKPKGTITKKTEQWEKFRDLVLNDLTTDVIKIVGKMTDEQKVDFYVTILKYFKPVQAQAKIEIDKPNITAIQFNVVKDGSKD